MIVFSEYNLVCSHLNTKLQLVLPDTVHFNCNYITFFLTSANEKNDFTTMYT